MGTVLIAPILSCASHLHNPGFPALNPSHQKRQTNLYMVTVVRNSSVRAHTAE